MQPPEMFFFSPSLFLPPITLPFFPSPPPPPPPFFFLVAFLAAIKRGNKEVRRDSPVAARQ